MNFFLRECNHGIRQRAKKILPMFKLIPLLSAMLLFAATANAQLQKILHQSFDVEEITAISLDLHGEYEIEKWAGNTILTETHIQLYDASPSILRFFVENGRYEIEGTASNETNFAMVSKDKVRKSLKTKHGECYEFIKVRILVPEDFTIVSQNKLVKNTEQEDLPVTSTDNEEKDR